MRQVKRNSKPMNIIENAQPYQGVLYHENGNVRYIGDFINNFPHGKGKQYREDGSIKYNGDWHKGIKQGVGTIFKNTSDCNQSVYYTGEISNDKPHGKGKIVRNNKLQIDGNFHHGAIHNYAILYFTTPTTPGFGDKIKYIGFWDLDSYHGLGTLYDINGNVIFEGEWSNGLPILQDYNKGVNIENINILHREWCKHEYN